VLIGDAIHASSPSAGQGASMAIEDAVTLARCLRDVPDPIRAFAAFEALRRERVERIVAYAARVGQTKIPGALGRRVRDLLLPLVLRRLATPSAHAWIYEHHIDWDAPVIPSAILPPCTASSARS
jgi:2-polyprenyl-6-methoxyphenol hydroxylase-like FAD-dependent oxidoreductase